MHRHRANAERFDEIYRSHVDAVYAYARRRSSQQVAEEVRRYFGHQALDTVIPRNVRLSEAPSHGVPVNIYDPRSRGADAYRSLAREMAERFALRPSGGAKRAA